MCDHNQSTETEFIRLQGVRQNNLKGFDINIPIGRLTVVTGLSGTGKSSLVFETLHAEGQRRYVETFSPYTRQFLEILDRPNVDLIENIRPSIAIQQSNTVKTSRSTVGTMTELCDFFKVWFCHVASLFDPSTGKKVEDDNPQSIWHKVLDNHAKQKVMIAFAVKRPGKLEWQEIIKSLINQGYSRFVCDGISGRLGDLESPTFSQDAVLHIIQDRLKVTRLQQTRFLDSARTALHFGNGEMLLLDEKGIFLDHYSEGLHSPETGRHFKKPVPAMFSFNSPLGACPRCRGFGRVIEIDYRLVIPDHSASLADGAIRAFTGEVYSESQRDLLKACKRNGIPTKIPFSALSEREKSFVINGEPGYGETGHEWPNAWYGVKRFFDWLESTTYKMHVRVFLSKYRSYVTCHDCGGFRLQQESLFWKWKDHTLPDLYLLPVRDLYQLLQNHELEDSNHQVELAYESIITRLRYLNQVGLDYLTLNRTSRTLSGGEVQRVNLTACLGTSLVDTLFVLDEPSVGLHSRDIGRLIDILHTLTHQGNTVIVVEHDESIMRAADNIIELGPRPGAAGGNIVFHGSCQKMLESDTSLTGQYLSGRRDMPAHFDRRPVFLPDGKEKKNSKHQYIEFRGASKHNIGDLSFKLPLRRLVCLSGVSGSGKSTLLNHVIYQGMQASRGKVMDDPARIKEINSTLDISEIVLVDQSPVSRTPRSNAAVFTDIWDAVRQLYAATDEARSSGHTASHFSFNSGYGRCDHCGGLGHEKIEMQFMADVYVSCPVCDGQRFKPEVLTINWNGKSISEILKLTVDDALTFFQGHARIVNGLESLDSVGLGYLPLGQPLNTLSGGESQRLKLVKYLSRFDSDKKNSLILLDEPTTGLHRDDVGRLLTVLHRLVNKGHSLVVIEHQLDILKSADWILEMGPEAGDRGGKIIFSGSPEHLARFRAAPTAPFLKEMFHTTRGKTIAFHDASSSYERESYELLVAEEARQYGSASSGKITQLQEGISVWGAREHNLKNLSISIPHREISVVTGVSGSGKSTLAFDIIFAEGQRRFMESMSAWARQYIEQMPKPDIDQLQGIPPAVAIEQRVTHGTRKSTVSTITEVAQYLRLLFARIGVQHSPVTGEPLVTMSPDALLLRLTELLQELQVNGNNRGFFLCAPLIRSRKGHHQPLANWARDHGYQLLRVNGEFIHVDNFQKLDRYKEHDIEVVVHNYDLSRNGHSIPGRKEHLEIFSLALKLGKKACFLADANAHIISWFSTHRTDPATGQSYPELDPKHFSWNSSRGWCPTCRGYGRVYNWMKDEFDRPDDADDGIVHGAQCPNCSGSRLNEVSRAVKIRKKDGSWISISELLHLTPGKLLKTLQNLRLDRRSRLIIQDLIPEIEERLKFMDQVGLEYLEMDRATATLSGGEAQRIRLAAQLGSNLSGVLYVLDEPSIGLHARDNERLLRSIQELKEKGNTLLIVEHDEDTMRQADRIIDLGPGAGIHGGEILANGNIDEIMANKDSLTGRYLKNEMQHPLRGHFRKLPARPKLSEIGKSPNSEKDWMVLTKPALRNLKKQTLLLPMQKLIMVCGISGAGKSTFIRDLLKPAVEEAIKKRKPVLTGKAFQKTAEALELTVGQKSQLFGELINGHVFRQVIEVDQSPIGKTPRSTPATYMGAFDIIRKLYAQLPEAKIQGHTPSTYSFNTKGGRCETCKGAGRIKLEMSFMPNTYVTCESCQGRRYGAELDDIRWNGKNISDVLKMSYEEAAQFFSFHSRLQEMMLLMVETGLGYLQLGQSSPTLSGGEAQRLKLVSELARGLESYKEKSRGIKRRNLYILEEPTIGLHLSDCERLIELLHRLVDQGHTVIVIEHHLDLIAEADYLVEIGPEGGEKGGKILYQGHAKGVLKKKTSPTAPFLEKKIV